MSKSRKSSKFGGPTQQSEETTTFFMENYSPTGYLHQRFGSQARHDLSPTPQGNNNVSPVSAAGFGDAVTRKDARLMAKPSNMPRRKSRQDGPSGSNTLRKVSQRTTSAFGPKKKKKGKVSLLKPSSWGACKRRRGALKCPCRRRNTEGLTTEERNPLMAEEGRSRYGSSGGSAPVTARIE